MTTISQALQIAIQHHQAGRLDLAEEIYRRILQVEPDRAEALHLLGVAAHQRGRHAGAAELIRRAIDLAPAIAAYPSDLGAALQALGQPVEAIACYRRALELDPNDAKTYNNLGTALHGQAAIQDAIACYRQAVTLEPDSVAAHVNLASALLDAGQWDAAIGHLRRALELNPGDPATHNHLANALLHQGKLDEAVACYRGLLDLWPELAEVHNNLATALRAQGKLGEAVASYRRAVQLKPDYAEAHNNLGSVLLAQGKLAEAVACHRLALQLQPDHPFAHSNLGSALQAQGKLDEAVACYQRALALMPDNLDAHNNLANTLKDQGRLAEALDCCRRAVELRPDFAPPHRNLVYLLHFSPDHDAAAIGAELRRWNGRHAEPLAKSIAPHPNDRSPDRRLRIGYVSPDFREHPVARFLLPLLEAHDHQRFEIYCYGSVPVPDAITDRCRAGADVWRDAVGLSDEQLAAAIRQDQVDILVDLTMHMGGSRLLVFARKPAPVQVTYLAYASSTGLSTIDYRLTDPYLDPPGREETFYTEQSIRLPETYWCYRPMIETPPVGALPAAASGQVTFGCLNNFCKVTAPTLAAWSRLLQAVPRSTMLLHAHAGSHRDRVRALLAQAGVAPERLTFVGMLPIEEYFRVYQRIDLALDPFPYGGGTTTCDALWMGVPVVSLAGPTAVGRGGLSILSNLGLSELATRDAEQYVRVAAELAGDLPRLAELRATLRDRMKNSPLMDAPRFARHVEAAYRAMWQRWCNDRTAGKPAR